MERSCFPRCSDNTQKIFTPSGKTDAVTDGQVILENEKSLGA